MRCEFSTPSPPGFPSPPTSPQMAFSISFLLKPFRTLPSSVSRKSLVCRSYENCRGYTNSSQFGTPDSLLLLRIPGTFPSSLFFSRSCALCCTFLHSKKTQLFSVQAIPHSASKNTTAGRCPSLSPRGQNETPNCGLQRSYRSERPRSPGRLA